MTITIKIDSEQLFSALDQGVVLVDMLTPIVAHSLIGATMGVVFVGAYYALGRLCDWIDGA